MAGGRSAWRSLVRGLWLRGLPLAQVVIVVWCFSSDYRGWRVYHGDPGGSHYSELDQINRSNVGNLNVAWTWSSGESGDTIECNPIMVDGLLYITTPKVRCAALDAASGRLVWRFDPWEGRRGGGVNRGVVYWSDGGRDRRIFHTAGDYLYALEAGSGSLIRTFGAGGRVNLRDGLDRDTFFLSVGNNTPGIIWKDLLIMGSVVGEGPGSAAPGHIRAYDVRTGKRRWIFHTIPHPGEVGADTWSGDSWKTVGGANAWGGFTLDEARGWVFCGTGSAAYDHWGGNRLGQNLYANCVLALDASTGELRWHFQTVHHDLWDYDLPTPPVLASLRREGGVIEAVVQPTKMGHLFVLDRETGEPLFPVEERSVPASEIPGELAWPTQPFPPEEFILSQQGFNEAEVTDLDRVSREQVLSELRDIVVGGIFTPPGFSRMPVLPQFNGGCEWGGSAFDPETRTVVVNLSNEAEWISMVRAQPEESMPLYDLGQHIYRSVCSYCHGFEKPVLQASPSLVDVAKRLKRAEILELMRTGRGQMPSFGSFSEVERRALVAFFFGEGHSEVVSREEMTLSWAGEIPFVATGHHDWRDAEGYPVNRRPWGELVAVGLDEGAVRWRVPLGTYPALEARGEAATGTFNIGGPVVTAGGLVFIGASMDERFHAYDKDTGELLWEHELPAGGYATPATYELHGRQYVVIAAGGGGKPGTKRGDGYVCFALPE
ncbi:MAG: hypothetical protein RI897_581 [Verrucomicrobiota bacterium]